MLSSVNEEFKKARNAFIGSLCTSVASFFIMIGLSGIFAFAFNMENMYSVGAVVGLIIAMVAVIIALFFFNLSAHKNLMLGCSRIATEENDGLFANKCTGTYGHYKRAILLSTIAVVAFLVLFWVPVLNVFLILFLIGSMIYYYVAQILIIVRVWQTYSTYNRP